MTGSSSRANIGRKPNCGKENDYIEVQRYCMLNQICLHMAKRPVRVRYQRSLARHSTITLGERRASTQRIVLPGNGDAHDLTGGCGKILYAVPQVL